MSPLPITINARQRCIIFALLQAEGRLTLSNLSRETGLTPRIIRYNLDTVRSWFKQENIKLTSRPGIGIEIDATKQDRKRLLSKMSQSDEGNLILTRGQRQRITLFELLTTDSAITYQGLAANEGISRSTIIHDVVEMQKWLNTFNLTLRRTQNKGAAIVGSEQCRRYALLSLIHEELGDRKWYSLWFNPDLRLLQDKSLPPTLEKYLKSLPFSYCHNTVCHIENLIGDHLALYSRIEVLVYLAISIDAIKKGHMLSAIEGPRLESGAEIDVAHIIFSEIGRKFSLRIGDEEYQMLSICLLASKWEEDETIKPHELLGAAADENIQYADAVVAYCANQLHPLLRVDQELLTSLSMHLKPVIHRVRYGLPITNECLDEIIHSYPEVYRSSKAGLSVIEKDLNKTIPEEEVGYVAMYLAAALNRLRTQDRSKHPVVILGDGIRAKAAFLKARLEYEFPSLEVTRVLNGLPENEQELSGAELVLSLVPIDLPDVATITISPFLSPAEKRSIHAWIIEIEERNRRRLMLTGRKPDLVDVFLPQHIVFAPSVSNWRDAVQLASQPLLERNLITSSYPEAMIKIIEDYGPYMVLSPGVILLHARPVDGVKQVCLSILVLENGVPFSDNSGEIDIAFVLGAVDDSHHLNVLFQLTSLIYDEACINAIRSSHRRADILRTVWNFSNPMVTQTINFE